MATTTDRAAESTATVRKADPPGTYYLYRGSFKATATHSLRNSWGGPDHETREMTASISGSLPKIKVGPSGDLTDLNPMASTVRADSASATVVVNVNNGRQVKTCKASTGTVTGPPLLLYDDMLITNDLTPYTNLSLVTKCSYSDGRTVPDETYAYGPLDAVVPDWLPADGGSAPVTKPFRRAASPQTCPGHIEGQTTSCSYVVQGELTFELIKKVVPTPDRPKPTPPPRKATLSPGATQVRTGVLCPKKCTITINLTPLKGGPTLPVPRIVRPKPGRVVTVKVTIPKRKRAMVKKAGGVRVKLTYKLPGGKKRTEVRKARL